MKEDGHLLSLPLSYLLSYFFDGATCHHVVGSRYYRMVLFFLVNVLIFKVFVGPGSFLWGH